MARFHRRLPESLIAAFLLLGAGGCASVGSLGLVTRSSADPASALREGRRMRELGPVKAKACRYSALGVLPGGNADFSAAVDKALDKSGGDALVNVTTSNSLYGLPLYNVLGITCTSVKGIAVKLEPRHY